MLNRYCWTYFGNGRRALCVLVEKDFCYSSRIALRVSSVGKVIKVGFIIAGVGFRVFNEKRIKNCTVHCAWLLKGTRVQ